MIDESSEPQLDLNGLRKPAFPDNRHRPAQFSQCPSGTAITPHVLNKLVLPETSPRLRCIAISTSVMAMPEAPVNEHHNASLGNDKIWAPRQVIGVRAKPNMQSLEHCCDRSLRACSRRADLRHVAAAFCWSKAVHDYSGTECDGSMIAATAPAIRCASSGGTAFPTCRYCSVRGPSKK